MPGPLSRLRPTGVELRVMTRLAALAAGALGHCYFHIATIIGIGIHLRLAEVWP